MSKIVLAVLTAAAFLYAVWLVAFGRELPRPSQLSGLRRRFALATLLFVGFLSAAGCRQEPLIQCYAPPPPPPAQGGEKAASGSVVATFQAAWQTLDPKQSEAFRNELQAAAERGEVNHKTAEMLAVAYENLAEHKYRTRGEGGTMTCYKPSPMGSALMTAREEAFKQVELLEKARASGAIDNETAAKAQATLARELEIMFRAKRLTDADRKMLEGIVTGNQDGSIEPGEAATVASGLIVEMEGGPAVSPTAGAPTEE